MKHFSKSISLVRNSRGCLILDTVKGCQLSQVRPGGCYGECYAAKIAARYRFDFGIPVLRKFDDESHFVSIARAINGSKMPFVRIGEMGDPSFDWGHTMSVVNKVRKWCDKRIVIITKHINRIPNGLLAGLYNICVNTSVSAMDTAVDIEYRLNEYNRIMPYCDSVLRVVSCNFNNDTDAGMIMSVKQNNLLSVDRVVETVFRPGLNNDLVRAGVVRVEKKKFNRSSMLCSARVVSPFLGRCDDCPDMCGITKNSLSLSVKPRQLSLWPCHTLSSVGR